jgi:putative restriction endonuclease
MKFYVHPTDQRWYNFLRQEPQQDVNFWKPKATSFKALPPNGPFLFLLNKPNRFIAGAGYYAGKMNVTVDAAWDIFGPRNGVGSREEFRRLLYGGKYAPEGADSTILCLTLNTPVFFERADWVAPPEGWSDSLVQGRGYDTNESMGLHLWQRVQPVLDYYQAKAPLFLPTVPSLVLEPAAQYRPVLVRPEQQAFRNIITQAYDRKCAISGEKTLPVLEAAHIQPYAAAGPSVVSNGLLLRSDLHRLFDSRYLTVDADSMQVVVSSRIRKEFSNGVEYYQFDGRKLRVPKETQEGPMREYLQYHNGLFMP